MVMREATFLGPSGEKPYRKGGELTHEAGKMGQRMGPFRFSVHHDLVPIRRVKKEVGWCGGLRKLFLRLSRGLDGGPIELLKGRSQ